MCGILGILGPRGRVIGIDDAAVIRMRDRMAHRGPDGAGLWRNGNAILAHRRLAVIDRSEAAGQPMLSGDGRYAIVYNGELYNDAELREELGRAGAAQFRTSSDTETVLAVLARWGPAGLSRLRGMYALGFYDTREGTLLIARDPLGIKPLYYRSGALADGSSLVFASEIPAILAHPEVSARPDLVGVSGYLTTIRTVLGERTMFEGVRTLRPGQAILFDASGDEVVSRPVGTGRRAGHAGADAAAVMRDSVERHLRSDVPICCLLSGGLDSSIVAAVAMARLGELRTYCSGTPGPSGEDFAFARLVAEKLGTIHTEAPVSREMFRERWPEMVSRLGVPLSTPNEVAINEVARTLRGQGNIVALSGEGADELFAGYDVPMLDAARFEGLLPRDEKRDAAWNLPEVTHPGEFQLYSNAWVSPKAKSAVLREEVWRALEEDHAVKEFYRGEFEAVAGERGDESPLQAHLRFHRRINLAGLLQRLDTATMLASVEGRTPFADREVMEFAEGLGMDEKCVIAREGERLDEGGFRSLTVAVLR
jgi:asparagine synthase (glutamine-hydrolysing)